MSATAPEYVTIGKIMAPWGFEGKMKVAVLTDFPERFAPLAELYVNRQPVTVTDAQQHKGRVVIKLREINSVAEVKKLQGQTIEIHRRQLMPLPEGQYYLFQIIGLTVATTAGRTLGVITGIQTAGGNDIYIISGEDEEEILIPAVEDVIKSIDLDEGRMIIEPIAGLLNLNSPGSKTSKPAGP